MIVLFVYQLITVRICPFNRQHHTYCSHINKLSIFYIEDLVIRQIKQEFKTFSSEMKF